MPQLERRSAGSRRFLFWLWTACLLFPVVHYLVVVYTAGTKGSPSSFLLVVLGLLRISCGLWLFARLSASPARFRWLLLAVGSAMAHTSTEIYFWRGLLFSSHTYLSTPAALLTAFACIPILLAIASNFSRKDPPAVREIDLALSFTLGSLFLVLILSPAVQSSSAAGVLSINRMIDCENLFLSICAALQFLASDDAEDRRFFYVFLGYMVVAAPLVSVRNRWAAQYPMAIWDLALDVSPLLFLLYALHPMPAWVRNFRPSARTVHLARGGSPLFMSLALTLLGIGVSRSHFYVGSAGILLGITGYGLRNAVIHGRLLETEESLLETKQQLEEQVAQDGLTGIPNRRFFDVTLRREWRAIPSGGSLAVLMIDIDYFKGLNDAYGHQTGDACLIAVAKAIHSMLPRVGDFAARYGGEEFAVILPGNSIDGALTVAERLRYGVIQLQIPNSRSHYEYVTISIGVAAVDAVSASTPDVLLKAADEALYKAKRAGRNRIEAMDLNIMQSLDSR